MSARKKTPAARHAMRQVAGVFMFLVVFVAPVLAGPALVVAPPLVWHVVEPDYGPLDHKAVSAPIAVIVDPPRASYAVPTRPPAPAPTAPVVVVPRSTPVPVTQGGRSLAGLASWYCRAGVSVCMAGHPPGEMVAAACGSLRRAMGSNWRGQFVTVKGPSNSVRVQLVDWCGSTSKTIDLYWESMSRLGGTGVLPVTVSW